MHLSVINSSAKMLAELRRYNYVTPTNYLELVKGYRTLLAEKSSELGNAANKLANGLAKLEDAREQVETLSKELEVKKVVVAQSQKDCEDLLVQIVSERRVAGKGCCARHPCVLVYDCVVFVIFALYVYTLCYMILFIHSICTLY